MLLKKQKRIKKEKKVDDSESNEENEVPALQINIGSQGKPNADEQGLLIDNKELKKERDELKSLKL